jgi:tetratricopeptide (TPR) repeat protein
MRMRTRRLFALVHRLLCGTAVAAGAAMTSLAQAAPDGKPPILVFEAHVGPRTEAAERVLGPLRDALESHGFAARPETILKIAGGNAPRPGIMDPGITASAIAQRVDDGYIDYTQNNFEAAIKTLNEAIRLIHRNPGVLALDTGNSRLVIKAYVSLANSHARLGHAAESVAAMTELIRTYPSLAVTSASFGPEAERLYRGVWKHVRSTGRGQLAITAGHPQALIFVDAQIRGIGTASLGDLIPGRYRVFIHVPGTAGRQYEIDVRPNEDSKLDISWNVDSSLLISDPWIGFQFLNEAQRGRESLLAGALARRWDAGEIVAVIGLMKLQDKPAVIGTLYRTDGKVIRSALLSLDEVDTARLIALAQFLADGTPAGDLEILAGAAAPAASVHARGAKRAPGARRARWVIYGGAAAVAVGAGLFLIDEDGVTKPNVPVPAQYWDTAPGGLALGAVGAASVGLGLWWSHRTKSSSAPTLSVSSSHAELGWAGRF